ncbi:cation efflux family protein [Trichomonas vaginalis G3]|uniref:Cation efflux family protein n=1 Tax=Trichomonas vaginalis (strain ATCC PRA-98 / G3) TaxID=412133 RepID=A2DEN5_TRIV3|nr:cation transmembrane transporter protein [Trichomonas vaginalis G3]EAY21162.1 cation efflux family protein [Trichomonas vaginalis G3]KAI5522309.1 cation transmembrane transporter protein [Trichomonas vaginalis G3]|eukprot:XP_001582148.1 cation efflux family protein [Trichomonas vaginalis G3]
MTEEEVPQEELQICPICHKARHLGVLETCTKCKTALTHDKSDPNTGYCAICEPLIPSSILEECSLAIAQAAPEDVGCTISSQKRNTKKYYKSMNSWMDTLEELNDITNDSPLPEDNMEASCCIRWATYISFTVNLLLLAAKIVAVSSSVSYTIISSVTDSALDIIAGTIISCTAAHSKFTREDLDKYPLGKSRVHVVGILVFSVLMAACALYIILQCILSLVGHQVPDKTTLPAIIIMGATIGIKLTMAIVYYLLGHPITKTLAEDHRNDVLTNSFGLFMYWGSSKLGWWMDSAGGIVLSAFIVFSWTMNALENAKMMLGKSAPPEIIRSITYVAAHHHPLIMSVEQVIAFQAGPMYLTELHIVVPGNLPLELAHWIGESLQLKVERMPDIERAWVHVDCESHNENEHVLFMRAAGKLEQEPPQSTQNVSVNVEQPQTPEQV